MKPLLQRAIIEFRSRPETEKPATYERSRLGKVLGVVAPLAAIGGFYAYGATRPSAIKHRALVRQHQYNEGLRTQPAPTKAPKYSDGGFDYGVKSAAKPTPKPVVPAKVKSKAQVASQAVANRAKKQPVRQVVKVGLDGKLRLVQFQDRNRDGTMGVSTNPLAAYRKASRVVPWVNRAGEVAGDVGDIASGKKVEKPFYSKPWFKRAAVTAAIAAPLLAGNLAASGERKRADGMKPRTGRRFGDKVDRLTYKAADAKGKLRNKLGLSAKPNKVLVMFASHQRLVDLAYGDALDKGWDVRDARGRSARVYAPGSRRRDRREKTWGEKTENIRAVRNVAIVGTVAGLTGAAVLGSKAKTNARTLKGQYREKIKARGGPRMPVKSAPTGQSNVTRVVFSR